jgi:hypothetical protein
MNMRLHRHFGARAVPLGAILISSPAIADAVLSFALRARQPPPPSGQFGIVVGP